MKSLHIVLIAFLVTFSNSLHITYHLSPQSYLSTLKSQQKSITDLLATLKSQSSQTQVKLGGESNILNKIKILEQAILRQKGQLSVLSKSTIIPLNESSWTCQNYAKTSQSQLGSLAGNAVNSISQLDRTVKGSTNQATVNKFSPDSVSALTSVQQIQKMIYSQGQQVSSLTPAKETNWLANNWVTGTKTMPQTQGAVKQTDNTNGYIQTCPLNTPFWDGNSCINCGDSTPYFNYQTKKCVNCQIYNQKDHSCTSKTIVTPPPIITNYNNNNYKAINRIIFPPNTPIQNIISQPSTPCPQATPFFVQNKCINCQPPNYLFDFSNKKCTACPDKYTFVPEKNACVPPSEAKVTNIPIAQNRIILPDGVTIADLQKSQQELATTQNVVACPSTAPFFNNRQCINCPNDQYFNIKTLSCQGCPPNLIYDVNTHKCLGVTYFSNLQNNKWISTNPQKIISNAEKYKKNPGEQVCPIERPFFNGNECVGCSNQQYFNFDLMQCQVCQNGKEFNALQHSCSVSEVGIYQTNVNSPNLIYGGFPRDKWLTDYNNNKLKGVQDCPVQRPFYSVNRCIVCPQRAPYFNLQTQNCENCQINVSYYSKQQHECLEKGNDKAVVQNPNIQKMLASIFS